jgi:radical SAM superfamily enzyme YgiQ (UPF0313 family)
MKFLLTAVNAKFIHSNPALYGLQAYAVRYGQGMKEHISLVEYTINNRIEEILSGIYKQRPDVIGFSCYIWNIREILTLVRELHKIMPELPIWLGGPEVSYRAEEVLHNYPELTGIMLGEGEATFLELLTYYVAQSEAKETKNLQDIRGIAIRQREEIIVTETRELLDLSSLPFLYDDLSRFEHKIIYYESSRGCPFCCSYCLSSIDKKVRLRDIELVKKELQFFLNHKVAQVKFIDRTFNCNHAHAMAIWQYIKEHDNGVTNFHFEIGADLLREEELALLNTLRPGAVQMEIGVQTTNPATLREIRRNMDIEQFQGIIRRLHQGKNIHLHLDLIAGLPFEDYQTFGHSFNQVYAMRPEQLQLGFLKVLSGSSMKENATQYGIVYTEQPPYEVLRTTWLSFDDICRLKQIEEMVELYYNSNQFTRTLPYLEQFFESPFAMYEKLGAFYERKGYFVNTPSRLYRYEVLLEFVREETQGNEGVVRELLTMDVYLRENAKSRPVFSKDLKPYKEKIAAFFRMEEKRRKDQEAFLPDYTEYDARAMIRMLHMEPFAYDIWREVPSYEKTEEQTYVLFDYQNRNPLTYEAAVLLLTDDLNRKKSE